MHRHRSRTGAALVVSVLLASACGARTGLGVLIGEAPVDAGVDATHPHDAATDAPQAPDVGIDVAVPLLACDGGYFLEVADDAGTTVLRGGCDDGGVPSRTCVPGGEDCVGTAIAACDDAGSMVLPFALCFCGPLPVGTTLGAAEYKSSTGIWFGQATIDVSGLSAAAATGDYDTTVNLLDGGGQKHIHGSFCVRP